MDNEMAKIITEIAEAFMRTMSFAAVSDQNRDAYIAAIMDDIFVVGQVIEKHFPEYGIDTFYHKAGYHIGKKQ